MQTEKTHSEYIRGYSAAKCKKCGECIAGCQYLRLTPQQAREIIEKVTAKPQWYPELASCIRCGKCESRCRNGAHPSDLMRECHEHKRRQEDDIPFSMTYGINGMCPEGWGANLFKDVYRGLGKSDRKILHDWETPKKSRDLLWIGCTYRMMPRNLEESSVLRNVAKFGGPDDCCGVWAMQAGLLDEGYRIARRLENRLRQNRFERLVVGCGHCQKVFTRVMPEKLGIKLQFPIVSIFDYFLEMIESGSARVARPMHLDAAISDSCFGYENGDAYMDAVRRLAAAIGMTVSELPHNRENSLCCGYGGLFGDGKLAGASEVLKIKRKDLALGGKKHIMSYCPGCHLITHYFQPGYESHNLMDDTLQALGDPVPEPFPIFYRRLLRPHIAWNLTRIAIRSI